MTEAESCSAKENAKSALLDALVKYIDAAKEMDMEDDEMRAEVESVCDEAGKQWAVESSR